jgi:hypothetical protein
MSLREILAVISTTLVFGYVSEPDGTSELSDRVDSLQNVEYIVGFGIFL